MNRILKTICIVMLLGGPAVAEAKSRYSRRSSKSSKPPVDVCKGAIDPYRPGVQKSRFFRAAGADNELSASEFAADRTRPNGFARKFDSWRTLLAFDRDGNKSIDWLEADAYRYYLRKKAMASYDANSDGKLTGAERTRANTDLARGRIATPPKSARAPKPPTPRSSSGSHNGGGSAELSALKAKLAAIRKRIYDSPALAGLRKDAEAAERAYENAKKAPSIAQARKPYDAARKALEKAVGKLPETREYEKAKQAYYAAYRKTPEYKAYYAARKKIEKTSKTSAAYQSARAEYEQAKDRYESVKKSVPEYQAYRAAHDAMERAGESIGEFKDAEDAKTAYYQVYESHMAIQRKNKDDAKNSLEAKLEQLVMSDPTARDAYRRIKQIEAKSR